MGESVVPLPTSVDRGQPSAEIGRAIGSDVASMLRYHLAVLDREDRLESGTGEWKDAIAAGGAQRGSAARSAVLRTLQMAADERYFPIIEALAAVDHRRIAEVSEVTGIPRLTMQERIADLVSAGLITKVPEADQVSITPAGAAIAKLVGEATAVAAHDLEAGL